MLRNQLKALLLYRVKATLVRSKRNFYEFGKKPSRLLARMMRKDRTKSYIPYIDSARGRLFQNQEIAEQFRKYFHKLYNLAHSSRDRTERIKEITDYIKGSGLPSIPAGAIEEMGKPITQEEAQEALKGSPGGKAPGPDGLSIRYYKTFSTVLLPHFLNTFNLTAGNTAHTRYVKSTHRTDP